MFLEKYKQRYKDWKEARRLDDEIMGHLDYIHTGIYPSATVAYNVLGELEESVQRAKEFNARATCKRKVAVVESFDRAGVERLSFLVERFLEESPELNFDEAS
jgi:hypothetical protein